MFHSLVSLLFAASLAEASQMEMNVVALDLTTASVELGECPKQPCVQPNLTLTKGSVVWEVKESDSEVSKVVLTLSLPSTGKNKHRAVLFDLTLRSSASGDADGFTQVEAVATVLGSEVSYQRAMPTRLQHLSLRLPNGSSPADTARFTLQGMPGVGLSFALSNPRIADIVDPDAYPEGQWRRVHLIYDGDFACEIQLVSVPPRIDGRLDGPEGTMRVPFSHSRTIVLATDGRTVARYETYVDLLPGEYTLRALWASLALLEDERQIHALAYPPPRSDAERELCRRRVRLAPPSSDPTLGATLQGAPTETLGNRGAMLIFDGRGYVGPGEKLGEGDLGSLPTPTPICFDDGCS